MRLDYQMSPVASLSLAMSQDSTAFSQTSGSDFDQQNLSLGWTYAPARSLRWSAGLGYETRDVVDATQSYDEWTAQVALIKTL